MDELKVTEVFDYREDFSPELLEGTLDFFKNKGLVYHQDFTQPPIGIVVDTKSDVNGLSIDMLLNPHYQVSYLIHSNQDNWEPQLSFKMIGNKLILYALIYKEKNES